jgi:RTX calcium-binding nonapeptide repeat (4 copies)
MSFSRLSLPFVCVALLTLGWPAPSPADHVTTSASVSAQVTERRSAGLWTVEIRWSATCRGAAPGTAWYDGDLYMIDVETGERMYVGAVVDTSGRASVSGRREWFASSRERPWVLKPELTIGCYENFPLHGGPDVTVTGNPVTIPPRFSGGSGGGGSGNGAGGGGGNQDPTEPLRPNGCLAAVLGTNRADRLEGGDDGDVMIGFAAGDRIRGLHGHDCLVGGTGGDRMDGGEGSDRLTGGGGGDRLVDRDGVNAFDAGPGNDFVDARNGARESVRCGSGVDRARVDSDDRLRGCEQVLPKESVGRRPRR